MPSSCLLTERRCSWPWSFTLSRNCCIRCVCDNDIWNFDRSNYRSVGLIYLRLLHKNRFCRAVCLRKRTWKKLWEMTCKSLVLFSSCLLCFFLLVFNLMEGNSFETYPFWDWNLRNINIRELHTGEIYMYIKSWKIHPEGDQCTLDMLYVLKSLECEFSDAVMSVEKNDAQSPVFLLRSTRGFFQVGVTGFCALIFSKISVPFERSRSTDSGVVCMLGVHWPGTRSFFQDKVFTGLRPVPPIHKYFMWMMKKQYLFMSNVPL